jgi:uncharacterized protein (TIGR01777 family)
MRIGITGATGLVGEAVASLARDRGCEVIAYSRRLGSQVALAKETLHQPAQAPHALPETRLDALVHLAGESLMGVWTPAKRRRIWQSRVDFTHNVVSHLATWRPDNRPKVLVCASGIGFYGDRGEELLEESSSRGTGFLADICQGWEEAAREAERLDIRVIHLRSGMVLGSEGGSLPLLQRLFTARLGGRLGSGQQWVSWVHLCDEAALILWAISNERVRGPLNACAPNGVTNAELTRLLAARLGRPALLHVPAFALRLVAPGMAKEMLLCSQHAIPRVAMDLGYTFSHPELEGALASLIAD